MGDAINNINSQGIKYFHTNSTGADSQALGTNSVAIGSSAVAQAANSVAIGTGASATGTNSVALGAGSTDGGRSNVVSVGSDSQQRQITNVAAGTQGTDAVNVNQLNAVQSTLSTAVSGQQTQINNLGTALGQTDKLARQGVAAATALTMLPQVEPGKSINVAVGVARFAGQSGMAFGASAHLSTNGILKLGIGVSGDNRTFGAGYGYSW